MRDGQVEGPVEGPVDGRGDGPADGRADGRPGDGGRLLPAPGGDPAPTGLLAAVEAYERALVTDDLAAMDRLFAPGPATLRGDGGGLLVGHDAIAAFRGRRGGAPQRVVRELHVRAVDDDHALVVAVTAPASGGRGLQTQLWRRGPGGWVVDAAHVGVPAAAVDPTVWRVVGTPLVAPPPAPARASAPSTRGDGTRGEGTRGDDPRTLDPRPLDPRPLAGVRVAVKDVIAVAGHAVGAGVPAWLAEAPVEPRHAPALAALLAGGAVVTGIARTDELAYSIAGRNPHHGTPPNVAVRGGLPGGSSSGPAAAVALGQADLGLGTDTAGSLRVPASYQGLWGLRTTHGRVPTEGVLPLAPSFDTVGWLTRDAATLRAAAAATFGASPVPVAAPARLVGVVVDHAVLDGLDPEVAAAVAAAAGTLDAAPVDLARAVGPLADLAAAFRAVQGAEAWRAHGAWIRAHPGALGAEVGARFAWASTVTPAAELAGRATLAAARRRLGDLLGDRALVLPSAAGPAPDAAADPDSIERTRTATLVLTSVAGTWGGPALSVPALDLPGGPVGLCLVGPPGSDLLLVDAAAALVRR